MVGKPFNFRKKTDSKGPRRNQFIRAPEVRVLDASGQQIGILKTARALELAQHAGLDLVEIAPTANPPVCKIIDYGKYQYDEAKKARSQKRSTIQQKAIQLGVAIADHDYDTKLRQAEEFLFKGAEVKICIRLRRYQMSNSQSVQSGIQVVQRMVDDLQNVGTATGKVTLNGCNISVILSPLPSQKRTLRYQKEKINLPVSNPSRKDKINRPSPDLDQPL